ncbi:hypothetical protein CTT31_02590 [Pseudoalteromonas maricaloris]|nr:hypothetical protein EXT47_14405 [Pseudoalteromonas sp. CO342X]USE68069.1 hypothetical protein CTT31_02590 [Pseudoalteromonas flavipulchra]
MKSRMCCGIALVQVLIMVAMISLFLLYIQQVNSAKIKQTERVKLRANAEAALQSAKAEVEFQLLTNSKQLVDAHNNFDQEDNRRNWNLHGKKFPLEGNVYASIQDHAGLISIHHYSSLRMTRALKALGMNETQALKLISALRDWQDEDSSTADVGIDGVVDYKIRNGLVSQISELSWFSSLDEKMLKQVTSLFTTHFNGEFNPLTAPDNLLRAEVGEDYGDNIVALRDNGQLTVNQFQNLTGVVRGDGIRFSPSNWFSVLLEYSEQDITIRRKYVLNVSPYSKSKKPVVLLEESSIR